jgi:nitrite reductase/ring-hydroxylating ferredoxin subunit
MSDTAHRSGDAADCMECPIATRRAFLRDAAVAVAGVIASLSIGKTAAAMTGANFPVTPLSPMGSSGHTRAYSIPATDGAQIDKEAEVILVRWQNAIYAFDLSCPHQNTALRWNETDHRFNCPKHHSQYQPDGEFITGRATRGMDRLGLKRDGANITVDVDVLYKQDEDPNGWATAVVKLA